jgi:hypothetical protein
MMKLAERSDGFEPPENFLNPLSNTQADAISFMAGGATVHSGTFFFSGHMRGNGQLPAIFNEFFTVVSFVGTDCDPITYKKFRTF